ncbi:MAG: hypothetical protein Ctma_0704 [Catillopecten margaritatus gill symbiont]|uniref:Uncharacterized protein n=1 Tax=Catillopecten margaritatus gill symbiont TaxID=3083288 RepID=A0AAU6PG42_9GAMM
MIGLIIVDYTYNNYRVKLHSFKKHKYLCQTPTKQTHSVQI